MARISPEKWQLAEDLFMVGKSLSTISKETGIGKSSISERAKKELWIKGKNEHLIVEAVELAEKTELLTEQQANIHNKEVKNMLAFKGKLDTFSDKVMKKANILIDNAEDGQSFKAVVDGVDKHSVTVGYNERFSGASTVINNTNAQQNNKSSMSDKDLDMEIDRVLDQIAD